MQSTILVILPAWAVFSLSLSLPPQILPKSTLSQKVNKTQQGCLEETRGKHGLLCYIFRLWVIIKAVLKQISLYLLSHFRIRIVVLTCPDNKSARNHQRKSCVPAKSYKSQWCKANIQVFQLKSSLPFSLFLFVWRLASTTTNSLLRHLNSGIAEDLHCSKAVDRNFGQNGGTTPTHSSLCSWAGVSQQIAFRVSGILQLAKAGPLVTKNFPLLRLFPLDAMMAWGLYTPYDVKRTNLHILTARGMSHILTRIGQLWSSRYNSYALVGSPNSKIMNQCNTDFNFLE